MDPTKINWLAVPRAEGLAYLLSSNYDQVEEIIASLSQHPHTPHIEDLITLREVTSRPLILTALGNAFYELADERTLAPMLHVITTHRATTFSVDLLRACTQFDCSAYSLSALVRENC